MRVTIEAIPLLYRSAGVKNYLYHWTRELGRQAGPKEIRLFPFLNEPIALDHQRPAADPLAAFWRLGLMFLLNRVHADLASWITPATDVFHCSRLLYPPRSARITATLHDATCWLMPEMHQPSNLAFEMLFAERILKRADGLIAVSETTRADAVRFLDLPAEKIRVIYHGIPDAFFRATAADADAVRGRHGLARPYALFVGTIEPRKNVSILLDAYLGLPKTIREEFDLILAGPPGWRQSETLARLRRAPTGVRYLGYVPEKDLPGLFAGATAFVYPSLYEGFGFPVAQAMAAGTPVVTSAVSALPEIAGGAGILVDPRSQSDLQRAIDEALTSPARRAEMISRGRINARRFSWNECARRSLEFFREIAG